MNVEEFLEGALAGAVLGLALFGVLGRRRSE